MPGIDSAGFDPGQTWVLLSYGFSKTQLTWIKQARAGPRYPNQLGPFKKVPKKPGFFWVFAGFAAKATMELDSLCVGSRTPAKPAGYLWVQEPSLPSIAGFIRKLHFSWVRLNK